jgi:hypothetical protein
LSKRKATLLFQVYHEQSASACSLSGCEADVAAIFSCLGTDNKKRGEKRKKERGKRKGKKQKKEGDESATTPSNTKSTSIIFSP